MARAVDTAKLRTWRRRLSRFDARKWTVAEFCDREGVTAASFYYWRRRLIDDEAALRSPQTVPVARAAGAFLPVEVLVGPRLEVELPNGVVLRCPLERDGNWRQVLEVVSRWPAGPEGDRC